MKDGVDLDHAGILCRLHVALETEAIKKVPCVAALRLPASRLVNQTLPKRTGPRVLQTLAAPEFGVKVGGLFFASSSTPAAIESAAQLSSRDAVNVGRAVRPRNTDKQYSTRQIRFDFSRNEIPKEQKVGVRVD